MHPSCARQVKAALQAQLADDGFIGAHAFIPIEAFLQVASASEFEGFTHSPEYAEMLLANGPKHLEITREDDPAFKRHVRHGSTETRLHRLPTATPPNCRCMRALGACMQVPTAVAS